MKITNIDAPKQLVDKVLHLRIQDFILDVIRPLEQNYYGHFFDIHLSHGSHLYHHNKKLPLSPIRKFMEAGYENVAVLIHTIPIYLRDSRPEICDENSIIDLLGAYYSNRGCDSPYIELYLKAIDNSVNKDNEFKWLFTKVLIHELAHAALDIFNQEHNGRIREKVVYSTPFGKWREESMANAVALRIIKEYGDNDFYDYAKQFMTYHQNREYALGVLMEDFDYCDFRSVFDSKRRGVDSTLQQEWLNYVKGKHDWEGLHKWNDLLHSDTVYLFEGNYYTREEELVYDIVNKILSNYEEKNGRKMSFSVFSSIFPYIKTGAEMSYEPAKKVKNDSRYKTRIILEDGDYKLYYWWDDETIKQFVKKANIKLTKYKN